MDVKRARELTKLINICKKNGVLELKIDGIELKLSPQHPKSKRGDKDTIETPKSFNEEDILFWSSTGLPEAQ